MPSFHLPSSSCIPHDHGKPPGRPARPLFSNAWPEHAITWPWSLQDAASKVTPIIAAIKGGHTQVALRLIKSSKNVSALSNAQQLEPAL
jgi:hypothetical protein